MGNNSGRFSDAAFQYICVSARSYYRAPCCIIQLTTIISLYKRAEKSIAIVYARVTMKLRFLTTEYSFFLFRIIRKIPDTNNSILMIHDKPEVFFFLSEERDDIYNPLLNISKNNALQVVS
jgi:hypothetical protein